MPRPFVRSVRFSLPALHPEPKSPAGDAAPDAFDQEGRPKALFPFAAFGRQWWSCGSWPERSCCRSPPALSRNAGLSLEGPFPLQHQARRKMATGPGAEKRFIAARLWLAAGWRCAKAFRQRILVPDTSLAWYRVQRSTPPARVLVARRGSFQAIAAASSFNSRPVLRIRKITAAQSALVLRGRFARSIAAAQRVTITAPLGAMAGVALISPSARIRASSALNSFSPDFASARCSVVLIIATRRRP